MVCVRTQHELLTNLSAFLTRDMFYIALPSPPHTHTHTHTQSRCLHAQFQMLCFCLKKKSGWMNDCHKVLLCFTRTTSWPQMKFSLDDDYQANMCLLLTNHISSVQHEFPPLIFKRKKKNNVFWGGGEIFFVFVVVVFLETNNVQLCNYLTYSFQNSVHRSNQICLLIVFICKSYCPC